MKSIYIILTKSDTILSKIVHLVTADTYTHGSIRKVVYMSVQEISKKWTMPVRDWGLAYSQLAIFFEDRLAA